MNERQIANYLAVTSVEWRCTPTVAMAFCAPPVRTRVVDGGQASKGAVKPTGGA